MADQDDGGKGIGFKLPSDVHRRLRVQAAAEDTTIQELTGRLLDEHLAPVPEVKA